MIPKFRAWDKENEKMLAVNDICNLFWENTFLECYELVPDPKGKREYELINHRINFEDCVIMQSTGLFDKNGKEIFERDIVVNKYGNVGYVAYLQQEAGFVVVLKKSDYRLGHRNTGESYDVTTNHKIIGNIYQNPELVEE